MSRMRRGSTKATGATRPLCSYGTKCYRRNPEHLTDQAHPWDEDYLTCCLEKGHSPEFVSIRMLFEWVEMQDEATGTERARATRQSLQEVWPEIQRLGQDVPNLDDDLWNSLDDDGNGFINFSEFAEFTTKKKVNLPLGLDDLMKNSTAAASLKCGVFDCQCSEFQGRRPRCRYAEKHTTDPEANPECYNKAEDHLSRFSHPCDADWKTPGKDKEMCLCGHKKKLHASAASGAAAVPYPAYWSKGSSSASLPGTVEGDDEFSERPEMADDMVNRLQALVTETYSDVTARDRQRHSGSWMVPKDFTVVAAWRNENSKLWRKYCVKKAELKQEAKESPFEIYSDVRTTKVWETHGDQLDPSINEWYLWHGTSSSAALNICQSDFKMRLAGSATGTLYGRGSYFAESVTKADEYSKEEDGLYTVLLCRVLGGRVKYTADRTPDPDALTRECTQGESDCILGDRIKISGTYREFIVFDTELVYPEYIIKYKRGELFKSPSHP